jgi:hypothetical protein
MVERLGTASDCAVCMELGVTQPAPSCAHGPAARARCRARSSAALRALRSLALRSLALRSLALRSLALRSRSLALAALACALGACSDDTCSNVDTEIGYVCTPDTAAPAVALQLDVRESCGTSEARGQVCTAQVQGGTVLLTLTEDHCNVGTIFSDIATCSRAVVSCKVPALGEGDYQVVFRGGPAQLLKVRQGGALSCRLPAAPPAP